MGTKTYKGTNERCSPGEMKIPGHSRYTIDEDLTVRSYAGIAVKILKAHRGWVELIPDGMNYDHCRKYSLHKLYFCCKNGINPANVDSKNFFFVNGQVVSATDYMNAKRKKLEKKIEVKEGESILERITKYRKELDMQESAVLHNDASELVEYLYKQQDMCVGYMLARGYGKYGNAEFLFKMAVDSLIRSILEFQRVRVALVGQLLARCRAASLEYKKENINMQDFYFNKLVNKQQ